MPGLQGIGNPAVPLGETAAGRRAKKQDMHDDLDT
jgi:hypothetical protein